jgi:DNA-binding XRE family transcriptional regulator
VWERPRFPLDVSWHTIQAIENRHLPLSERIAHTIAARVGIKAAYLLRNELPDPLPDPAKIRERFKKMERYDIDGHYYTQLSSYPCTLVCPTTGDHRRARLGEQRQLSTLLGEATLKGLDQIGNRKLARRVYDEARAIVKSGGYAVGGVLVAAGQELQQASKTQAIRQARQAEAAAAEPPPHHEKIKKLRSLLGLSVKQLANRLHVTTKAISSWEQGDSEPEFSICIQIDDLLDKTIRATKNPNRDHRPSQRIRLPHRPDEGTPSG